MTYVLWNSHLWKQKTQQWSFGNSYVCSVLMLRTQRQLTTAGGISVIFLCHCEVINVRKAIFIFFCKKTKREELLGFSLLAPFIRIPIYTPMKRSFTSYLQKNNWAHTRLDPRPSHPWPILKADPEKHLDFFRKNIIS